jgi:transcriptional regulator of aromatic amino acid metabolism
VNKKELFPEIIGSSRAMRGIFGQILKVAPTDATVLITGESGPSLFKKGLEYFRKNGYERGEMAVVRRYEFTCNRTLT